MKHDIVFGMNGDKIKFSIGHQSFTLDYIPEDDESFNFMCNMLIKAFESYSQIGLKPVAITGMRDGEYVDSTPLLHVGSSSFEDWFQAHKKACTGDKQLARDAYAAGMGDPLVTYATSPKATGLDDIETALFRYGYERSKSTPPTVDELIILINQMGDHINELEANSAKPLPSNQKTSTDVRVDVFICPEMRKPGGCKLHNIRCGFPKCNQVNLHD